MKHKLSDQELTSYIWHIHNRHLSMISTSDTHTLSPAYHEEHYKEASSVDPPAWPCDEPIPAFTNADFSNVYHVILIAICWIHIRSTWFYSCLSVIGVSLVCFSIYNWTKYIVSVLISLSIFKEGQIQVIRCSI